MNPVQGTLSTAGVDAPRLQRCPKREGIQWRGACKAAHFLSDEARFGHLGVGCVA